MYKNSSNMLNFTVGPVMADTNILGVGSQQIPYFRTSEFSDLMFENENLIKNFINAPKESKVIFITGSGTASMEAVVMNCLSPSDRTLIINGGSFGQRFVNLCNIHSIPYTEIKKNHGKNITEEDLRPYDNQGYTALLVNSCETSTGTLYDLNLISQFCKRNGLFLIIDDISSFMADPFDFDNLGCHAFITGSQKALACPPGISIITLSKRALSRVQKNDCRCMYFDLKDYLNNAERGQTPFTPAVGILIQINSRLKQIEKDGGISCETNKIRNTARFFRDHIKNLPLEIVSESLSNAVTPLHPTTMSAYELFIRMKDEYNIWICPNGGDLKHSVFRVGHLGHITQKDNECLIAALQDILSKQKS